jgi:ribose transport system permease protein
MSANLDAYFADRAGPARVRQALSFRNISALYVLGVMIVIFSIWIPHLFLTTQNLKAILYQNSVTTIVAVGLVAPFAAGAFDASVGGIVGLASVGVAYLMTSRGVPWVPAALIAVAVGALTGLVSALIVVVFRVQSIIATLGMLSILTGLGSAFASDSIVTVTSSSFLSFGSNSVLGVAFPVWILLALAAAMSYVLDFTVLGRHVYATGGSEEVARLAGVRTQRIVIGALVLSGAAAAFAGVVATARVGAGQAAIGPPYLLPAFAAVFLGATQFKGGRFNVWGTVVASYTLAVGVAGLNLAGAPVWLPDVFNGAALLLAVSLSVRRARLTVETQSGPHTGGSGSSEELIRTNGVQPLVTSHPGP